MKVKVSEASDLVLDWMVARALGKRPSMFIVQQTGRLAEEHNYSTDPAQAWPIIEREGINIGTQRNEPGFRPHPDRMWHAQMDTRTYVGYGPTGLIAAMRCYVASKLGDEVKVPEELFK